MPVVQIDNLKGRFETGDIPTGGDFVDLIDTLGLSRYVRTLVVDASGNGDFTKLSDALASINDASASNRYRIYLFGPIVETETINGKSHIDVFGQGGSVTVDIDGAGAGIELDSIIDALWLNVTVIRDGLIPDGSYSTDDFPTFAIIGSCDETVILESCCIENISDAVSSADHFTGLMIDDTSSPRLIDCVCRGSALAQYGHGLWYRGSSSGVAINCKGIGNDNGNANNNWGVYIYHNASPKLINCEAIGGSNGANGYGMYIRGSASPELITCHILGGDHSSSGNYGLHLGDSCRPRFEKCLIQGGINGANNHCVQIANGAAPMFSGVSVVPRQRTGSESITATDSFIPASEVSCQVKGVFISVSTGGGIGSTISLGTTPGGVDIVNALDISSSGDKYPEIVNAGNEPLLSANDTVYVTINSGSPVLELYWSVELAPGSSYGINISGFGDVRIDQSTIIGNCLASYAIVIGSVARTADVLNISNSHIEQRPRLSGSGVAIYTGSSYNPAPIYNCFIIGGVTNITAATGTTNGSNIIK